MISTPEHLADFTSRLDTHKVIGLDTEADSLHSYYEKVCLVQVCSPDGYFLVDPLAEGVHLGLDVGCTGRSRGKAGRGRADVGREPADGGR